MNEMISFIDDNFKVLMFAVVCLYVLLFIAFKVVEEARLFKIYAEVKDIYCRAGHILNDTNKICDKICYDSRQRVAAESTYKELVEVHNTIKKLNKKTKKEKRNENN